MSDIQKFWWGSLIKRRGVKGSEKEANFTIYLINKIIINRV
jgi:hypothetical protein